MPFRFGVVQVSGQQTFVAAFDGQAFSQVVAITVESGSLETGDDGLLVTGTRAAAEGWKVGDTVTVGLPAGAAELPIAGIISAQPIRRRGHRAAVGRRLEAGGVAPADSIGLRRAERRRGSGGRAGRDQRRAGGPANGDGEGSGRIRRRAARARSTNCWAIIYALLGLAVIIAVLGIVNTLALSVIERTREVGLLRAVGMSRRQLRSMIRLESVAISVLGAVLGHRVGADLRDQPAAGDGRPGHQVLSVPVTQLLIFVVLAGVVGVLAAVLPARRAARMDVLRAITAE